MKNRILRPAVMLGRRTSAGRCKPTARPIYTESGKYFFTDGGLDPTGDADFHLQSHPRPAMANILPFCLGMLVTYYATAMLTDGVYSRTVIIGWTAFAFCSPALAWLTWKTKEKGVLPKLIGAGVVAVSMLSSLLIFDGLGFHDIIIDLALVYFLFIAKARR